MIFDTDILIWYWRGNERAAAFVDAAESRSVSVVSYMELVREARDRDELRGIKMFLQDHDFHSLPLTENIGHRAAIYMEEYGLRMALGVPDALIAATAVESKRVLATGNKKHFSPIKDLEIKTFRPH